MPLLTVNRIDTVAVVTVDNPPVNALGQALRQALYDAAESLDSDSRVKAVVLTCAGRTFIAGADVREFDQPPVPPHLPDVVARLEAAAKPWIAAIHGAALGGGLEVALGCRFRIAAANASLGLPEVTLGLVPGAGGTVRLPRLIGVEAAFEIVTTGKPISALRARELGLLDAITEGDLVDAAVGFAMERLSIPLPQPLSKRSVVVDDGFWQRAEEEVSARAKGEAAPLAALACLRNAVLAGFEAALAFERATFLERRASQEAATLRAVFVAERAAVRPERLRDVAPRILDNAAVVGGGTMGAGIAMALINAGLTVTLVERDAQALAQGHQRVVDLIEASIKRGKTTAEAGSKQLAQLQTTLDYADLADVDLVIEAVFEDLSVKRQVFKQLEAVCRLDALLATNTSYLDPREIAMSLAERSRFIGLHFFSPAHVMRLLEIVSVPETSQSTLATAYALAQRLKKIPVEAGICEGFIGNRILKRYRTEAETLLREGVGMEEVDAAMRAFGFAMGPFEAQDLGGLDIAFLQRESARAAGQRVPEMLGDILVRAGRKGQKTGGGWYDYRPGERRPILSAETARLIEPHMTKPPVKKTESDGIAHRLIAAMAHEGEAIVAEGVAHQPQDVDLVEIHGYGFPRHKGGPMHYVASLSSRH